MRKTIAFFEQKGKRRLKEDDRERVWYADFLEFVKNERIFATLLTPAGYGAPDCRWDTWRNCEFAEILGFYGLAYWYTWQVSVLGLGPIWMSRNAGDQAAHGAPARRGRDLRVRPLRARPRRRRLLDRDAAGAPGRRQLPGAGREVLHRQRQPGGAGLDLRKDRGHAGLRLLRRSTRSTRSSSASGTW